MILEPMDLLRVEAALLRAQLPELVLRPGMTLPARVMERHSQMGLLLLAGTPLAAQLPDELKAGDRLRPRVEDVGEQVVLRTVESPASGAQQAQQTPPPEVALPLPGGRQAEIRVTEQAAERRGDHEGGAGAAAAASRSRSRSTTTRPPSASSTCGSSSSPAARGSR